MRVVFLGAAVVSAVAAALGLAAAAAPTRVERYRAGDLAELRRAAAGQPLAALVADLGSTDRATALAAITALPAHPDAPHALAALATVAGSWDRSVAAPAAAAALAIARNLDGDRAIRDELDDEALADDAAAWTALADRADRWSDVRAAAVTIALALTAARVATADTAPDVDAARARFYTDDDPEVRLAALEATPAPAPDAALAAVIARATDDGDAAVRLVALQVVCAGDAPRGLRALGDAGRAALYAVTTAADASRPGALLDAARCLAVDDAPEAARALAAVRQHAPRSLRAPLADLARRRRP
jgi:hypothetical protein